MADVDHQLFQELKHRYPEVPDIVVTRYMTQLSNNRERCIEMLTNESPKYLFGGSNPGYYTNSTFHELPPALSELNIGEHRPRSDSSGSNMSNASSSSSSSRQQLGVNRPGFRGPITVFEQQHPTTAPVVPNDISHFMDSMNRDQMSNEIPHINCSNSGQHTNFTNRTMSYGGPNVSGNPSGSASPALRPIEVQHIQTGGNESRDSPTPNQQSYTYKIQIHPNMPDTGVMSHGWPYAVPSQPNVLYQSPSQDVLAAYKHHYINAGATSPYKSPGEEKPGLTGYAQGASGPPRSSQTTIYLSNPTAPNVSPQQFSTIPRTLQPSPVQAHYNPGSLTDLRVSQNPNLSWNNVNTSQMSPQANQRPVVFEIKTPQRSGVVQSQIQYFDNMARTTPHGKQTPGGTFIGHMPPQTENPVPDTSTRTYHPERPSVINIQGATSRQDSGFLQFPPMPNECRVPQHQHGPLVQKTRSVDSPESVFVNEKDYRHIPSSSQQQQQQPLMSPASSPNSVSSGCSAVQPAVGNERQRSGSVDDPAYLQALLSHQSSRKEKLYEDLNVAEDRLSHLKNDVTILESRVIERKRQKSNVFPSSVDLARLRGDNLQLQAEIQLMTREIDLCNNGTTPLGVLDPLEQQNFYKNMNTGQRGSIYASTSQTPKTYMSTVTAAVTSTVTTPTRPPPEIPAAPPQLPPRDPPRDVPPPLPPRISVNQIPPAPSNQTLVNSGDSDADGEQWSCSACTFLNHPALNKCECCEMPRMNVTSPVSSPRGSNEAAHVHTDQCYCHH